MVTEMVFIQRTIYWCDNN